MGRAGPGMGPLGGAGDEDSREWGFTDVGLVAVLFGFGFYSAVS